MVSDWESTKSFASAKTFVCRKFWEFELSHKKTARLFPCINKNNYDIAISWYLMMVFVSTAYNNMGIYCFHLNTPVLCTHSCVQLTRVVNAHRYNWFIALVQQRIDYQGNFSINFKKSERAHEKKLVCLEKALYTHFTWLSFRTWQSFFTEPRGGR